MSLQDISQRVKTSLNPVSPSPGAPALPNDTGHASRFGLKVLGFGFGGFLLWAALAPLDEGVPCTGLVTIDTKSKVVQHPVGGIIQAVLVREGQHVDAGQVLLRIDQAVSKAGFETARQRYMGLRAMEDRLLAEQRGQERIVFHPELRQVAGDPLIRQHIQTQEQLFQSRRASLRAELQAIQESIEGQQGGIASFENMQVQRKAQLALFNDELSNTRDLVKEGYVPRNRQLELERAVADTTAVLADIQGNLIRSTRAIGELRQRTIIKQQEFRKDVEGQLADIQREVQADAEKYRAAGDDLVRTEIKAPVAGQVVSLVPQTVGGVIQSGEKLMDIVPERQELVLEARIPPHLIDRVTAGLSADIRFSSFAHSPQLVVEGKVESISGDLVGEKTPQGTISYFLARLRVTPEGIKQLGKRQMQPGMPAEVVIKTGARSLLTYLLHPLTKRIAGSMKEE